MRKTILTILGSAALAASFVQVAAATERHHVRKVERAPVSQPYRKANRIAEASLPVELVAGGAMNLNK